MTSSRSVPTWLAITAIAAVVVIGTTACSKAGATVHRQLSHEGNLANQRKVASAFIREYPHPDFESIRFTNEGSVQGSGTWSASAIVTVHGKNYDEILGTSGAVGDGLPAAVPSGAPHVTVTLSDGTSELMR